MYRSSLNKSPQNTKKGILLISFASIDFALAGMGTVNIYKPEEAWVTTHWITELVAVGVNY